MDQRLLVLRGRAVAGKCLYALTGGNVAHIPAGLIRLEVAALLHQLRHRSVPAQGRAYVLEFDHAVDLLRFVDALDAELVQHHPVDVCA